MLGPRLLIFFLLLAVSLTAQTTRKKTLTREYYPDSIHVKKIIVTIVKRNKYVDLFNYYKLTKTEVTEFSMSGKKHLVTQRKSRLGAGPQPCYEIRFRQTQYDENGNRLRYESYSCDKRESIVKEYKDGKLIFVREHRRRKRN